MACSLWPLLRVGESKATREPDIIAKIVLTGTGIIHTSSSSLQSSLIIMISWLWFVFFTHAFFECNLRAVIIAAKFPKAIDSAQDLLDAKGTLMTPFGSPVKKMFAESHIPAHKALGRKVVMNDMNRWLS